MHYLKSFVMTLSLFVLTVPVIQAGDVKDINSMVKKTVSYTHLTLPTNREV